MGLGDRMKFLLLLSSIPTLLCAQMPLPWKSVPAEGHLVIDSSFEIEIHKFSDPRIHSTIQRFTARLARETGLPVTGGHPKLIVEPAETGGDESYQLDIAP